MNPSSLPDDCLGVILKFLTLVEACGTHGVSPELHAGVARFVAKPTHVAVAQLTRKHPRGHIRNFAMSATTLNNLFASGVNISSVEWALRTPAHAPGLPLYINRILRDACSKGFTKVVELTLGHPRCDPNRVNALHAAAAGCSLEALQLLMRDKRVDVNLRESKHGRSALHCVTYRIILDFLPSDERVELLMRDKRVIVNLPESKQGRSALHCVTDRIVLDFLLSDERVEVNARDSKLRTPLCLFVTIGREDLVKGMLRCEAVDRNKPAAGRKTPLYLAVQHSRVGMVRLLLADPKVDPNAVCVTGGGMHETALMCVARCGRVNAARAFCECKREENPVDFNVTDAAGRSALHYAVFNHKLEVARMLFKDSRVDTDVRDEHGKSALEIAVSFGLEITPPNS